MDIKTFSVEKLKAIAFDTIVEVQQLQNSLNTIQAEIARRASEEKKSLEKQVPPDADKQ